MSKTDNKETNFLRLSAFEGLLLVIVAALTLEATSVIQYFFTQRELRKEAALRADSQMKSAANQITDIINQVETAVNNNVLIAQWCLDYPDSLPSLSRRIIENNPVIVGSAVAFTPGYDRRRPLFSPYVFRDGDGFVLRSLATPEYDYPSQEWFTKPLELDGGYWSEPYVDDGGGDIMIVTYSVPVKDRHGVTAAVLTADISLDWLRALIRGIQFYPNATNILISREGRFMVSPRGEELMLTDAAKSLSQLDDSISLLQVNRQMRSGQSGNMQVKIQGQKTYLYFSPVERTGWSMCIVVPESDIFGAQKRIGLLVTILMLIGILLICMILRSFAKNLFANRKLNAANERMEGELHIARSIQMSMIPKTFPPFPQRHDLDMAAAIVPAKEVGGDLYDFFIRDEKLYFSIGDVSGKGVPASLVMAVIRTTFRTVSAHESDPQTIVSKMNNILADMNENNMFATFFCGVLDLADGHLAYCNAGHNPPLILTDAIRELPVVPNLPLGVLSGMEYQGQEMDLHYDDALFLYTDGLNEAENAQHEQFGMDRIEEALHGRKESQFHLETMQRKVEAFVDGAPQSDDLTLLFIHYLARENANGVNHRLVFTNDIQEISRLPEFVEGIAKEKQLDSSTTMSLNLALEEAVTNVILYAYPPGTKGKGEIRATVGEHSLTFTLSDDGKPFDPTASPEVDISLDLAQRRIGGLGIHLVRQIMDTVRYEWKNGKNLLTMTKII